MSTDSDKNGKDSRPEQAADSASEPASPERKANGQYKPTVSGNLKGRPKKRERALIPRQMTKDILAITEERISVKTPKGPKKISAIELALVKLRNKALENHGPSLRRFISLHFEALRDHYERHDFFKDLENAEKEMIRRGKKPDLVVMNWLNNMRRITRRT